MALTWPEHFFICFIIEEILESIRAKKGDIDIVKSPEEIDKDKNETENSNSKDAEKSREVILIVSQWSWKNFFFQWLVWKN